LGVGLVTFFSGSFFGSFFASSFFGSSFFFSGSFFFSCFCGASSLTATGFRVLAEKSARSSSLGPKIAQ
jgi:hypothetical protein